jgi:hypothetical protein
MNQPKQKGPKSIPSQVQLPGGIVLKAMPFKIVEYNPDGSPRLFELQPPGPSFDIKEAGTCMLFAREELLRNPWPGKGTSDESDKV